MDIKNICVYCASSNKAAEVYGNTAYELGALLAREGITVITGAGSIGLMRMVEDGALDNIPSIMKMKGEVRMRK